MKYHHHIQDHHTGKITGTNNYPHKKHIFIILFFITLTILPLYFWKNYTSQVSLFRTEFKARSSTNNTTTKKKTCNLFNGTWVPHFGEPYYTNETCKLMIDEFNCIKFGRRDTDFLKWRWKPNDCELPLFNASQFLNLVRGKSMAFLGDSVGKNQLFSLLCLLSQADNNPEEVSEKYSTDSTFYSRYIFHSHNFTVARLWAPFLVRSEESDPAGFSHDSIMNLYLDEPSGGWLTEVEKFDVVVVSAGQWFFRPALLHLNRTLVGCYRCGRENVTDLVSPFYAYRQAFRTVFRTLLRLGNYRGVTILRTFSPSHFEGGKWNNGGSCVRAKPLGREVKMEWFLGEMSRVQVEELEAAKAVGEGKGLEFLVMDTTEAMFMRPDGHPNYYGRSPGRNASYADCVHWCLPGPVDAWNEILLYLLRNVSVQMFENY